MNCITICNHEKNREFMTGIIIITTIIIFVILIFIFSEFVLAQFGFNKRCEGNPYLKYFEAKDFDNLEAEPIEFKNEKEITLRGYLYSKTGADNYNGLIIFSHGMGAGHTSYTTEINYFAKNGFLVLGFDNTGTCRSDGNKIDGFARAVLDLASAIKYVKASKKLRSYPLLLVGHSWGAYSVCNVTAVIPDIKIDGILAWAPFNSINKIIDTMSRTKLPTGTKILDPMFTLINKAKYGKFGNLKCSDSVSKNNIPTMIIQGDNDPVVTMSNSPASMKEKLKANRNTEIVICNGKQHNPYMTFDAETYMGEILRVIDSGKPKEGIKEYCDKIDYRVLTEEDKEVMKTGLDFLIKCSKK